MPYEGMRVLTEHEKESLRAICSKMDIFELRNLAREMGIRRAHNYVKDRLIDLIIEKQMVNAD